MAEDNKKTRTFKEMLDSVTTLVKNSYSKSEWDEVLNQIDAIVRELNWLGESGKVFQDFTIDELSRIWAKLSILQFNLIEIQKFSYQQTKVAESQYDIRLSSLRQTIKKSMTDEANLKWEKAPTVDDVTAKIDSVMSEYKLLISLHNAEYESLKNKYFSINTILHRIETRIKYLHLSLSWGNSAFVWDSRDLSQGVLYDLEMPT